MQSKLSVLLFQQPEIFYGAIESEELEEDAELLDGAIIFDVHPTMTSPTGLFFHWPQTP
jgi:hypothetical protein